MASPYEVRRFDELESVPVEDAGITWRPIRRPLGIRAFGINAYSGDEGKHVVEEHTERTLGHEEVYTVIAGSARFTLGDDEIDVPAGAFVYVRDPATKRGAVALQDGTTVLAVGGKPGGSYEPSAWELSFAAAALRARGDYEGGLELLRTGLEEMPGPPGALLYDIACYEALLGRREDALEHLGDAVAAWDHWAGTAQRDEDFASLRDDPEFLAIAGEPEPGGGST